MVENYYLIERKCTAAESSLVGVRKERLINNLNIGDERCPEKGKSILVRTTGRGIDLQAIGPRIDFCVSVCSLCGTTPKGNTGLSVRFLELDEFEEARGLGVKVLDLAK